MNVVMIEWGWKEEEGKKERGGGGQKRPLNE